MSCDNLLCDGHGRPPNPSVVVEVADAHRSMWIRYSRTEVIEVSVFIFPYAMRINPPLLSVALFKPTISVYNIISIE